MQAILLLPMIVCIVALFRRPIAQVFLWVYLPVLLLVPTYFSCKLPNLPPFNASEAVLLPLGLAMAWRLLPRWKLTTADLWLALYLLSTMAFYMQTHQTTIAWFSLFHNVCQALVPYAIGKVLIEQADLRLKTVRHFVVLVAVCCPVALVEYFAGRNPFVLLWARFFPYQQVVWLTQFRWGFGRVAGPYGQSELAGMVLFLALALAIWAGYAFPWKDKFRGWPHPFRIRTLLIGTLVVTLFSTQARGPWLGCLVAVPMALLGRTRHLLRNGLLLLLCCTVAGGVLYARGGQYVQTHTRAATDEQQTAQYRRQLLDLYIPVAQSGGAWGLGTQFPVVFGSDSVDNAYLFVWLVQGWVGLATFVLLCADTVVRLVLATVRSNGKRDRFFALTLLGAFSGILLTIGTVFLSQQPYQLFFLIAGWAQSVRTVTARAEERRLSPVYALT